MTEVMPALGPGDPCPYCSTLLIYDEGTAQSRKEPGQPEAMLCTDCGVDLPVDQKKLAYHNWAVGVAVGMADAELILPCRIGDVVAFLRKIGSPR